MKNFFLFFTSFLCFSTTITSLKTNNNENYQSIVKKTKLKENFNNEQLKEKYLKFLETIKYDENYENVKLFHTNDNKKIYFKNFNQEQIINVINESNNTSFVLNFDGNNFSIENDIKKNYLYLNDIIDNKLNLLSYKNYQKEIWNFNYFKPESFEFSGEVLSLDNQSIRKFDGVFENKNLKYFHLDSYDGLGKGKSALQIFFICLEVIGAVIAIGFGLYAAAGAFFAGAGATGAGLAGAEAGAAGAAGAAEGAAGAAGGEALGDGLAGAGAEGGLSGAEAGAAGGGALGDGLAGVAGESAGAGGTTSNGIVNGAGTFGGILSGNADIANSFASELKNFQYETENIDNNLDGLINEINKKSKYYLDEDQVNALNAAINDLQDDKNNFNYFIVSHDQIRRYFKWLNDVTDNSFGLKSILKDFKNVKNKEDFLNFLWNQIKKYFLNRVENPKASMGSKRPSISNHWDKQYLTLLNYKKNKNNNNIKNLYSLSSKKNFYDNGEDIKNSNHYNVNSYNQLNQKNNFDNNLFSDNDISKLFENQNSYNVNNDMIFFNHVFSFYHIN